MGEEKDSKSESEGEQAKDERQFDQEQYDEHGRNKWRVWAVEDGFAIALMRGLFS